MSQWSPRGEWLQHTNLSHEHFKCWMLVRHVWNPWHFLWQSLWQDSGLAYQYHHTDAFGSFHREDNPSIDSNYVDGISLIHGSRPRQHIWTFAAALDEVGSVLEGEAVCSCSNPHLRGLQLSPSFIGRDYFCDSGVRGSYFYRIADPFYVEDPLWDGAGCGTNVTCCSFNNPPWFHKVLPSPTTDNIEMRVCRDESSAAEDIAIASIELYAQ